MAFVLGCGGRTTPEGQGTGGAETSNAGYGASSSGASTRSEAVMTATTEQTANTNTAPPLSWYSGSSVVYCSTDNQCPAIPSVCDGDNLVTYSPTCEENYYCAWQVARISCPFGCADAACKHPPTGIPR
jgi:hypothetical protein